jgi:hypothetical protein
MTVRGQVQEQIFSFTAAKVLIIPIKILQHQNSL